MALCGTGEAADGGMLLKRGADPNVHVYASGPPVHKAFERRDPAMLELLKRYGGVVPPVTVGLSREKELARQMLIDEAEGRVLPPGSWRAGTSPKTFSAGPPTAAIWTSFKWLCRGWAGPGTTIDGTGS